jgi:hypothetical protein
MTIQEASDKLTELCHQGHAQARLMFISGADVKEVENFEMLGEDTALVRSQIKWPGPPQPKKTVEACKICDQDHEHCKYGNNCRTEVEV